MYRVLHGTVKDAIIWPVHILAVIPPWTTSTAYGAAMWHPDADRENVFLQLSRIPGTNRARSALTHLTRPVGCRRRRLRGVEAGAAQVRPSITAAAITNSRGWMVQ